MLKKTYFETSFVKIIQSNLSVGDFLLWSTNSSYYLIIISVDFGHVSFRMCAWTRFISSEIRIPSQIENHHELGKE